MMNLFPNASEIALFHLFPVLLSAAFIPNFMELIVHPSLEIIPFQIALLFSEAVFHRSL